MDDRTKQRPGPRESGADPLAFERRIARLTDDLFTVPILNKRIGLDGLVGVVPILGTVVGLPMSVALVAASLRHRPPKRLVAKMAGNIVLDTLLTEVPVIGDVADVLFRANARNFALLERHLRERGPAQREDRVSVGAQPKRCSEQTRPR